MPIIKNKGEEIDYCRVFGGMAWPADKPGFVVAVGEHAVVYIHPAHLTQINYHVLDSFESWDITALIKKCIEFKAKYHAAAFYGRYRKAGMDFLFDYNNAAYDKNLPRFDLDEAPNVDREGDRGQIQYHLNTLQTLIRDGVLHKRELEGTQLYGHLLAIPQQGLQDVTDKQFPGPGALCYACIALKTLPTDKEMKQEQAEVDAILDNYYD